MASLDKYDGVFIGLLILIFVGLSKYFYWFTLDDAYITLRYSKHLAEGHGIVWNVGADPVEGYTSSLWMIIGTIPHAVGLPPITFIKILGVVSTILTIVVIYGYGRFRSISRWILIVGSAQIAVSPAIALLSIQGMETTTAMLLVLLVTIMSIELIQKYWTKWAIGMNIVLFAGMLARPDLVVFGIFLEAGIAGLLYRKERTSEIKYLIMIGFIFVFLPGLVFILIRYWYFGYLFPNPFYVKSGFSLAGPVQVFEFVMLLIGPLLFITLIVSLQHASTRSKLIELLPLCLASISFLILHIFITPIQGFLHRFLVPIFPATILVLMLILDKSDLTLENIRFHRGMSMRIVLIVLLISGLFVYPLFIFPEASNDAEIRTQGDRVVMGQALESLESEEYRMFVTESGAIPYYSEWEAVDRLGLNNETIAHRGLNQQLLSDYDPDLIQMLVKGQPSGINDRSPPLATYINNNPYALVAVVHKQNTDKTNVQSDKYHVYFVNTESDGYRDISCVLISQNLKYANRSVIIHQNQIDVTVPDIKEDCN